MNDKRFQEKFKPYKISYEFTSGYKYPYLKTLINIGNFIVLSKAVSYTLTFRVI